MCRNGLFITLEGGEGAGKSTQARLLAEKLTQEGYDICLTREIGGTERAEALRDMLLFGEDNLHWQTEVMLIMAARFDHLFNKIYPALEQNKIVICDRFHDSTWAYQGYGVQSGSLEVLEFIKRQRREVACEPNITFWLDLDVEIGAERLMQRGRYIDRYEGRALDFHERVRKGFQQLYDEEQNLEIHDKAKRIEKIDASRDLDEIHCDLYMRVKKLLNEKKAWRN